MRWERLFGELEGQAEQAHAEERDALVAELREGEWAERSWLDRVQGALDVELEIADAGTFSGRVRLANETLIHLDGSAAEHVIATDAVRWVRGLPRAPGPAAGSVAALLGWGHVLREMQEDADAIRAVLIGGAVVEGSISAVGRDFLRVSSSTGRSRDVPTSALRVVSVVPDS